MSSHCLVCLTINLQDTINCIACGAPLVTEKISYHLPLGTKLTHNNQEYQIEKTLGEGGFGITYKGINVKTQQPVAIKENWPPKAIRKGTTVIWPSQISKEAKKQQLALFIQEGKYINQCEHPNIVKVYSWFIANNTAYIVMEFIAGESLLDLLKKQGRLLEKDVKKYFLSIGQALKLIHSKNLLHRDIKPDNIIITKEDKAILIDFGNSREFMANQNQEQTRIISPGYSPIEQYALTGKKDATIDIYACCASMYELLTGKLPPSAIERINIDTLIPPREIVPNLDTQLEAIILSGMKMRVEDRLQTADDFIEALQGKWINPQLKKARKLVKEQQLVAAVKIYKRCLQELEINSNEAAIELAMVLVYLDDNQAKSAAEIGIKLNPEDSRGYGVLGLVYCRQGNWLEGEKTLQIASQLEPKAAWILTNLAWALGKLNKWQLATQKINLAFQIDPESPFILGVKTWIKANQKHWKKCIRNSRQALFLSNQSESIISVSEWVYPCLIMALEKTVSKQATDVERCCQEFINQLPNNNFAWGFKAWKQAQEGLWSQAENSIKNIENSALNSEWILINQGIIYEYQNQWQAAINIYQFYLQRFTPNPLVLFRLSTLLAKMKKYSLAKNYLQQVISIQPKQAAAYHNLGWILLKEFQENPESTNISALLSMYRQAVNIYIQEQNLATAENIQTAFSVAGINLN